jgi:hypothetical protein
VGIAERPLSLEHYDAAAEHLTSRDADACATRSTTP